MCLRLDFKTLGISTDYARKSPRTLPWMMGGASNDVCALKLGWALHLGLHQRNSQNRAIGLVEGNILGPEEFTLGFRYEVIINLKRKRKRKNDEVVVMWYHFSCRFSAVPTQEDTPPSLKKPIFELGSDHEFQRMRSIKRCFGPQVR